jgi:hypothetical protein
MRPVLQLPATASPNGRCRRSFVVPSASNEGLESAHPQPLPPRGNTRGAPSGSGPLRCLQRRAVAAVVLSGGPNQRVLRIAGHSHLLRPPIAPIRCYRSAGYLARREFPSESRTGRRCPSTAHFAYGKGPRISAGDGRQAKPMTAGRPFAVRPSAASVYDAAGARKRRKAQRAIAVEAAGCRRPPKRNMAGGNAWRTHRREAPRPWGRRAP